MSTFDPNTFLDAAITEPFTKRPLLPPGDYVGTIGEIKPPQSGQGKKDPTKTWYALNVPIEIETNQRPGVREMIGQEKVVVFDFVGLDINDSTGSLDTSPGRNRQLAKYREALGMNDGSPFRPASMQGRSVLVKVGQRDYQGEQREEVQGVAKVA
jgi:hypothetical protein